MKKIKLLNRITVFLCVLCVLGGTFGGAGKYYASNRVNIDDVLSACGLPKIGYDESRSYLFFEDGSKFRIIAWDISDLKGYVEYVDSSAFYWMRVVGNEYKTNIDYYSLKKDGSQTEWRYESSEFCVQDAWSIFNKGFYELEVFYSDFDVYSDNSFTEIIRPKGMCIIHDYQFVPSVPLPSPESYNSELGYLQNIQRKNLTLDGEDYNPDYDSWKVMFLFDSTSTTGLDITSGDYSVRHFMSWEVRDKDSNVIRTYDKVSCGEYDAAGCKISYPLYSTRQAAMNECGFEALSWWESGVLGYEVYIYDYLQLVRTNEDGSVEYGGYVRIDENGYVADTLDDNFTEDPNGYLDKDVSSSSGSGSSYEDAEHDADKNASNSGAVSDFMDEMNDMVSMVTAVPQLFGALFSFLPDWCLNFLGVGVGFSVVLLIWKAARG